MRIMFAYQEYSKANQKIYYFHDGAEGSLHSVNGTIVNRIHSEPTLSSFDMIITTGEV